MANKETLRCCGKNTGVTKETLKTGIAINFFIAVGCICAGLSLRNDKVAAGFFVAGVINIVTTALSCCAYPLLTRCGTFLPAGDNNNENQQGPNESTRLTIPVGQLPLPDNFQIQQ